MKILILGSSSFAARGLPETLERYGHEVWTFNRTSPFELRTPRDLSGDYSRLAEIVEPMRDCDALINFAIVKFGSVEENRVLLGNIVKAANAHRVGRFIHISSISVLPSRSGVMDETSPAVKERWRGAYSGIKADAEHFLAKEWHGSPLVIVRPGFILGEGIVDSIVGIGMPLPTGHLLGLGNRRTIIPLIRRDDVHNAITKLATIPLENVRQRSFMLVSPAAPTREEYLNFHCRELGRGVRAVYVPPWLWKWGLAMASVPLSLWKGRRFRLATLFAHNIAVRHYDCAVTSTQLHLDMDFDWREELRGLYRVPVALDRPESKTRHMPCASTERLLYVGFGRVVRQRHLPALGRIGFRGTITAIDSALAEKPKSDGFSIEVAREFPTEGTHAVITAPWPARAEILRNLPQNFRYLLVEKPLAVSRAHLAEINKLIAGRSVWVMHNYRRKANAVALRRFMQKNSSGALRHVTLRFETPSPFIEKSAWIRHEKEHRVLIADYSIHFLDLAWLFFDGAMKIQRLEVGQNPRGELESLSADISFANGNCTVLIRQGCHRREAHIHYCFQNYDAHLRFFPDVFAVTFGGHSALDDLRLATRATRSIVRKIADKIGLIVADRSHDEVLAAFAGLPGGCALDEFSVNNLLPFYERLTHLTDAAYE